MGRCASDVRLAAAARQAAACTPGTRLLLPLHAVKLPGVPLAQPQPQGTLMRSWRAAGGARHLRLVRAVEREPTQPAAQRLCGVVDALRLLAGAAAAWRLLHVAHA